MKFIYADPPYPGQAKKHYGREEVDHAELVRHLVTFDVWALSTSSPALRDVLNLCPKDARVAAWVKPFASFKPGVNPAYTWEPVIFSTNIKRPRSERTVRDFVSCNITLKKGLSGAKPELFCFWLFDLLGVTPEYEFIDMFPGTGAVTDAWGKWKALWRSD